MMQESTTRPTGPNQKENTMKRTLITLALLVTAMSACTACTTGPGCYEVPVRGGGTIIECR